MMNTISKWTLLSFLILRVFVSDTHGAITVECIPIGGTNVAGGQVVEVECFVTTDVEEKFVAYVLDFACDLPGKGGSTGTIGNGVPSVNVTHGGFPSGDFLFGPRFTGQFVPGLGPVSEHFCTASGLGNVSVVATLPAGESAYLATMFYEVSDCATGEFNVILENFSDPPENTDVTRFLDLAADPIPFSFTPATLTVVTGTCCDGSTCLADDINPSCCAQNHPGALFVPDKTCADQDPCVCDVYGDVGPFSCNGIVDIDDLLCGLFAFGDPEFCPQADIFPCGGGNGVIDIDDIVAMLGAFAGDPPCSQ